VVRLNSFDRMHILFGITIFFQILISQTSSQKCFGNQTLILNMRSHFNGSGTIVNLLFCLLFLFVANGGIIVKCHSDMIQLFLQFFVLDGFFFFIN
jgi:hypothetical protein